MRLMRGGRGAVSRVRAGLCVSAGLCLACALMNLSCGERGTIGEELSITPTVPTRSPVVTPEDATGAAVLTVVYASDERGEIRSCGCAKMDLGGLGRRSTYVQKVREQALDVLLVHAGDLFGPGGEQAKLKAQVALQALGEMKCDAATLGEMDMEFGTGFLKDAFAKGEPPYVSTNVVWEETHEPFAPHAYLLRKMPAGYNVLILAVTSPTLSEKFKAEGLKVLLPEEVLPRYLKRLGGAGTFVVLLAHTGRDEAGKIAASVKGIDLIVVGHIRTARRPEEQAWKVADTVLVQAQPKGKYVGRTDVTLNREAKVIQIVNENVAMTNTFPDSPEFAKRFEQYKTDLLKLLPTREAVGETKYATSRRCLACHQESAEVWQRSSHARAMESLTKVGQDRDPECLPCHALGYGEEGGFVSMELTPDLANVHCENCHGAGLAHLADQQAQYSKDAAKSCSKCHIEDFSPDFQYGPYWMKIAHR